MSLFSKGMFEPYLKSFYIRSTDPTQIKVLKVIAGVLYIVLRYIGTSKLFIGPISDTLSSQIYSGTTTVNEKIGPPLPC